MRGSFGRNNFVFRRAAAYSSEYTDNVATAKGVSVKTFTLIFVTMIATLFGIFVLTKFGPKQDNRFMGKGPVKKAEPKNTKPVKKKSIRNVHKKKGNK